MVTQAVPSPAPSDNRDERIGRLKRFLRTQDG